MCTAVTYKTEDFYFGRTLDYERSYGEEVVIAPRNYRFSFRHEADLDEHYAIIGMAHVAEGFPLYYDAVNEKGLCMAGLNFVGNAVYAKPERGKSNVAQFEFIPYLLGQCATVEEVRGMLEGMNIVNTPFNEFFPPAQLHWIIAGNDEAITVEQTKEGLKVYENHVGVLANNPTFDKHMFYLNNYMNLSPKNPGNGFSDKISLETYCQGMGAIGLPGDWSSQSRFVRAAFAKLNSVSGASEAESVSQFFHIMETVNQPRGCNDMGEGKFEITLYTGCCNADKGIYYYTTYENRQITGIDMNKTDLNRKELTCYPLIDAQEIHMGN